MSAAALLCYVLSVICIVARSWGRSRLDGFRTGHEPTYQAAADYGAAAALIAACVGVALQVAGVP